MDSDEKIEKKDLSPKDKSLNILVRAIMLTFFVVLVVSGTVALMLMSDKSMHNNENEKALASITKDSEKYAEKMIEAAKKEQDAKEDIVYNAFNSHKQTEEDLNNDKSSLKSSKEWKDAASKQADSKNTKGKKSGRTSDDKGNSVLTRASEGINHGSMGYSAGENDSHVYGMSYPESQFGSGGNVSIDKSSDGKQEYGDFSSAAALTGSNDSSLLNDALSKARNEGKFRSVKVKGGSAAQSDNTFSQAKAVNRMMAEANGENDMSAAHSIADTAWTGSTAGDETLVGAGLDDSKPMVVDVTESKGSGNDNTSSSYYGGGGGQQSEDIPEVKDSENVTPWVNELKALRYIFMAAMAMLAVAAALADTTYGKQICIATSAVAMAMSAVCVALAITIMVKYQQYALGGMWLAISGVGLALCAVGCISGIAAYRNAQWKLFSFLGAHLRIFFALCGIGGGLLTGILGEEALKDTNQEDAKQYCKDHPDHAGCKTSLLHYKIIKEMISDNSEIC